MTDMKMTDQIAGHENAGHKIARNDKYLFIVVYINPSNFSNIVENSMLLFVLISGFEKPVPNW